MKICYVKCFIDIAFVIVTECGLRSYFSSPAGKYFGMNFGSCKYSNFHGNRTRAKRFGNAISHHSGFVSFENVCKKLMGIGNHSNCFKLGHFHEKLAIYEALYNMVAAGQTNYSSSGKSQGISEISGCRDHV